MSNKTISIVILVILIITGAFLFRNEKITEINLPFREKTPVYKQVPIWDFRSVDTVKYSRDLAGQMMNNPNFDSVINKQVSDIASLGASHVAISTPYDAQFMPFLKRWVEVARKNNLKVWFRGNFSGWENWFEYSDINRDEHKRLLKEFILANPDLFEDGDIFTSCPECENGGPGDPRHNSDLIGHRKFLIDEYNISEESFKKINKKVRPGFYSMNYDVANLVMDEDTTNKLGNLVVIDHYIKDTGQLAVDSKKIAEKSKGQVILGELGAPIPDIHGSMSEEQQSQWLESALKGITETPEVVGVNYWTNVGGSTGIWNGDYSKRKAVDTIKKYYNLTKTIKVPQ